MIPRRWGLALISPLLLLVGCATNPVTGESELALVSEVQELEIGREQYGPTRQMQGGDYTADPELVAYVQRVGNKVARVSDRKLPYEFSVVNDSTPNAWALPGGKIAVNRGLLTELDNEAELAAVLGHEVVHAAARHSAQGIERGILLQGAVLATGVALGDKDYAPLAVGSAAVAASLVNQKYGRDAERESDYYGMQYMARAGYDPKAAVSLQETFVRLSKDRRQDWLSGLFASHPPSQERVEANRRTAAALGSDGELGEAPYRRALAHLRQVQPAYDAYDEGQKALQAGQTEKALQLARKAIGIEPKEARFYALRGDTQYKRGRYQDALKDYDQALGLDSGFFRFYLQRGLTKEQLGDRRGARADLERSASLLPTASALNGLGQLALAEGDQGAAKRYLRQAAESESAEGRQAAATLAKIEGRAASGGLETSLGLDRNGYVLVRLVNRGPRPVRAVRLSISYADARGRQSQRSGRYSGTIAAGQGVLVPTRLGPLRDRRDLSRVQVQVLGAQGL